MKALMVIGLVVLILGIGSLFVAVPHTEKAGIQIGKVDLGIQTRHDERVSSGLSIALILGGVALIAAGNFGKAGS